MLLLPPVCLTLPMRWPSVARMAFVAFLVPWAISAPWVGAQSPTVQQPQSAAADPAPRFNAKAQPRKSRPRIALVLEGGGALGYAHIGVIEYLEQHHIPVDLVVGTSMGGLVGGLYASGRSPDQIRALVQSIDWDAAIGGRTPFEDLSYRRKQDRVAYPNHLDFGLKHGISTPEGLSSGQQVGLILDRATLPEYTLASFDDLPIPFRCVATNMSTGRAYVFSDGPLAQAMRATMSIPGIFPPVQIRGTTYTDGGAVDNLPVDVAKANHADIVIASYLDAGQPTKLKNASFLSAAGATISIMIAANELHSMEQADILVRSDLKGYTSMMFDDANAIIPKGEQGAAGKASVLDSLSVDDEEWSRYVSHRNARRRTEVPAPQFLTVTGADATGERDVHERLDEEVIHRPLNPDYLDLQMTRFVGLGTWNAAGYALTERNGLPGLAVTAYPKSYGPPFLNVGITIDGADLEDVLFGMSARLTFNNLGGYRAEWRTDAFFGYTYGVRSEYYRPITTTSRWFVAPRGYATSTRFDFYNEGTKQSQYQIEQNGFGFDGGYTSPRGAELRIGQDEFWYSVNKRIDYDDLSIPAELKGVTSLRFNYLGGDNAVLPLRGANVNFRVERHERTNQVEPFTEAEARIAFYQPLTKKSSVFVTATGGTAFGAPSEVIDLQGFPLGGPFRLGSYGRNELLGNQYLLFQGGYERKLLGFSPFIGEGLYAVGFLEGGKVYNNINAVDTLESEAYDASFAVVARTALGPIYAGGAAGDHDHRKIWFGLGRIF